MSDADIIFPSHNKIDAESLAMMLRQDAQLVLSTQWMPAFWNTFWPEKGIRPGYLDGHQDLLLVRRQVVALSQEDFSKGSFSELPLQHDVVSLYVLNNCWNKIQTEVDIFLYSGSGRVSQKLEKYECSSRGTKAFCNLLVSFAFFNNRVW